MAKLFMIQAVIEKTSINLICIRCARFLDFCSKNWGIFSLRSQSAWLACIYTSKECINHCPKSGLFAFFKYSKPLQNLLIFD